MNYRLTSIIFLWKVLAIGLGLLLLSVIVVLVMRVLEYYHDYKKQKDEDHLKRLIDHAIIHHVDLNLDEVPANLREFPNLLPILEQYEHNFSDSSWVHCKRQLIEGYLESELNSYLDARSWQKRQEGLRLGILWPDRLIRKDTARALLEDPVYLVRVAAAHCLLIIGNQDDIDAVIKRMSLEIPMAQYPYRDFLIHADSKVFSEVQKLAEHEKDPLKLAIALDILSTKTDLNLLKVVEKHIHSEDCACRLSCVKIIGNMPRDQGLPLLINALSDPDPKVRAAAAEGLGKMNAADAVKPLIHLLADPDWITRLTAAFALKAIVPDGRDALYHLHPKTTHESYEVAQYVLSLP
jgi:hypothetical protein